MICPEPTYVDNLGRCGLRLDHWQSYTALVRPDLDDMRGGGGMEQTSLSWTDGKIGIFRSGQTDCDSSSHYELMDDVVAFGLPLNGASIIPHITSQPELPALSPSEFGVMTLPKGTQFQVRVCGGHGRIVVFAKTDFLRQVSQRAHNDLPTFLTPSDVKKYPTRMTITAPFAVHRVVEDLLPAADAFLPDILLCAKAYDLIWRCLSWMKAADICQAKASASHVEIIVRRIQQDIQHDPTAPLDAEQLARTYGTNRTKLRHMFKSVTGRTMNEYRRKMVMEKAVDLLQDPQASVSDVAMASGFNDLSSFSTAYKRSYGFPPSKKKMRK